MLKLLAFLNIVEVMTETKASKWHYKMDVISNAKYDFLRFWLSTFFLLGESLRVYKEKW